MSFTRSTMVLSLLFLLGCAATPSPVHEVSTEARADVPPVAIANTVLFQPTAPAPAPAALIGVSTEQAEDFLAFFNDPIRENVSKHHRVRDYLESRLENFGYLNDTLPAPEALARHQGNCMSLAALTLALSNLAGLESDFQVVNTPPVFDRTDQMIVSSNHVRGRVYDPDHKPAAQGITLQRAHILIDYFPGLRGIGGHTVSQEEFLAMFYRNLAAEALLDDNPDFAFTLAREALVHHADYADALNLLAILHRRAGDPATAETYYRRAVAVHGDRVDILNNYAALLRYQGRIEEADSVEDRLADLDDPNPFRWLELGEQSRQRGALRRALQWYAQALEIAPYLHEAYWRKAMVYEELGQSKRSAEALERAKALSHRPEATQRYQAKLYSLSGNRPGE